MTDSLRVLRPLDEAEHAIRLLDEYRTPADLARAVLETWRAVEHSLRLLLRADRDAPDELRLVALSPAELPTPRLIDALRQRDTISLELAGIAHELERAAARAERGEVMAADADVARQAVARLRAEAGRPPQAPSPTEGPPPAPARGAEEPGPAEAAGAVPPERWSGARRLTIAAAAVAVLVLVAFLFALLRSLDDQMDAATAAFAAGRLDEAEAAFRAVLEDAPEDVTAHLYLGRINRRQGDYAAAAEYLRNAVRLEPEDPDVRRELGHLFMDLERPGPAAEQYERALEAEPEDERAWIGLILALRAAGDPRAEAVLRQAPPEVRAVLSTGG
ncbi:MAG TPA: tetratricopeptide repeat protein [Longimicrobiales bacterium]